MSFEHNDRKLGLSLFNFTFLVIIFYIKLSVDDNIKKILNPSQKSLKSILKHKDLGMYEIRI